MVAVDETVQSNASNQIAPLVEKLQSGRARDRWTAADALGRLGRLAAAGDGTAVPALLRCTEDEDDDVRCAAARALGHLGSETEVATLLRLLTDEDGGVRWGAAEGLGNLGSVASSSAAALKEALEDEEEDVRAASAQSLGKLVKLQAIAAADVVSSLIEVLSDEEWSVRRSTVQALGRCGAHASDAVATLRTVAERDRHPQVRKEAENALNNILGTSQA